MSIPDEAHELQETLNQIADLLEEARKTADEPPINSGAVKEPLDQANQHVRTASEQLANVVAE
ncbi:MAG: hypothetical protein ABEJ65_11320 [bacterium]